MTNVCEKVSPASIKPLSKRAPISSEGPDGVPLVMVVAEVSLFIHNTVSFTPIAMGLGTRQVLVSSQPGTPEPRAISTTLFVTITVTVAVSFPPNPSDMA